DRAETLRERDQVRVAEVHRHRAPEADLLVPPDHAVAVVPPDQRHHRNAQTHGGLELLHVHEKPAVSACRHHPSLRERQLRRDRAGKPDAHGRKPVGDEARVGNLAWKHAPYPELVSAYVADYQVLWRQGDPHLGDEILRAHRPCGLAGALSFEPGYDPLALFLGPDGLARGQAR